MTVPGSIGEHLEFTETSGGQTWTVTAHFSYDTLIKQWGKSMCEALIGSNTNNKQTNASDWLPNTIVRLKPRSANQHFVKLMHSKAPCAGKWTRTNVTVKNPLKHWLSEKAHWCLLQSPSVTYIMLKSFCWQMGMIPGDPSINDEMLVDFLEKGTRQNT